MDLALTLALSLISRSSHRRCSVREGVLGIFSKLTRKHMCQSLFFKKIVGLSETLEKVFSCEFCEISKNTFFTEHLWATASLFSEDLNCFRRPHIREMRCVLNKLIQWMNLPIWQLFKVIAKISREVNFIHISSTSPCSLNTFKVLTKYLIKKRFSSRYITS